MENLVESSAVGAFEPEISSTCIVPRRLKRWVTFHGHPDNTGFAEPLILTIRQMNNVKLSPSRRFVLLEILHPVVDATISRLRQDAQTANDADPSVTIPNERLVRQLMESMVNGFRMVFDDYEKIHWLKQVFCRDVRIEAIAMAAKYEMDSYLDHFRKDSVAAIR